MVRSFEVGTRGFESGGRGLKTTLATTIEDFEWGGPFNDRYDDGSGSDVSGYSVQQNTVLDGSYSLQNDPSVGGSNNNAYHESDTLSYPFKVEFYVQTSSITSNIQDMGWIFYETAGSDQYIFEISWDDDRVRVIEQSGGGSSNIINSTTSESLSANSKYRYEVTYDDGTAFGGTDGDITVKVFNPSGTEIFSSSVNDTTHTDGSSYGWYVNNGSSADHFYDTLTKTGP